MSGFCGDGDGGVQLPETRTKPASVKRQERYALLIAGISS